MRDDAVDQFTAHELTRGELQALMARSDGPGLIRAAWHLGALAVTGTLLWMLRSTVWVVPLIVAHGYALAFLFCAFHEMAHRTAFRTRWLNAALGTLAGFLTFWPYRNYRVFHWEHHRHTQDLRAIPSCTSPSRRRWPPLARADRNSQSPTAGHRHADARPGPGRRAWMAASSAPPDRGSAWLSGRLCRGGGGFGVGGLARRAAALDRPVSGRSGVPAAVPPSRAHQIPATRACLTNTRTTLTLSPVRLSRGTCRTTPSTTPIRQCRFTPCPVCTSGCAGDCESRAGLCRGQRQGEPVSLRSEGRPTQSLTVTPLGGLRVVMVQMLLLWPLAVALVPAIAVAEEPTALTGSHRHAAQRAHAAAVPRALPARVRHERPAPARPPRHVRQVRIEEHRPGDVALLFSPEDRFVGYVVYLPENQYQSARTSILARYGPPTRTWDEGRILAWAWPSGTQASMTDLRVGKEGCLTVKAKEAADPMSPKR